MARRGGGDAGARAKGWRSDSHRPAFTCSRTVRRSIGLVTTSKYPPSSFMSQSSDMGLANGRASFRSIIRWSNLMWGFHSNLLTTLPSWACAAAATTLLPWAAPMAKVPPRYMLFALRARPDRLELPPTGTIGVAAAGVSFGLFGDLNGGGGRG